MKNYLKNGLFGFLFLGLSIVQSGCVGLTIGSALVGMLPGAYDHIDKNSPSSSQNMNIAEMENVVVVTLKDLDFSIEDVKENVLQEKENLESRTILSHPAKAKKEALKVEVHLIMITEKVTKIVVTAKDSSLSYDGATAQAIMDEILVNVEMEKSYVDIDKFLVKADKKNELKESLEKEKAEYAVREETVQNSEQQVAALKSDEAVVVDAQSDTQPAKEPVEAETVETPVPNLKKKINTIIASKEEKPFIKQFDGLGKAPYTIKIGTFGSLENVARLMKDWKRKGQNPFYSTITVKGKELHRVFLNRFPDKETASEFIRSLKEGQLFHGEAVQPFEVPYAIQAGECLEQGECEVKMIRLAASGVHPYLHMVNVAGDEKFLLLVGGYESPKEAAAALESMENLGLKHTLIKP